ncbi:MAG: hypothetical protein A2X86_22140 [Bdellovibrionales bacterium GWA2_49_15]|nr:MAG: hypothetical protein A2X86_22140 [Bdellovibrionales bacterium GWA2_49_15]HAZ14821.1 hypothetical protein [Bdellovibrionales bacterium]
MGWTEDVSAEQTGSYLTIKGPSGTIDLGTLVPECNYNLEVNAGQIIGFLEGKNPTLLFRFILGLGPLASGSIEFPAFKHLRAQDDFYLNLGLAQRDKGLLSNLSLQENIELPARYHNFRLGEMGPDELARKALRDIMIPEDLWHARPDHVNWEIRKRVLLARAVVCCPKIVLLEDPTDMFPWEKLSVLFGWIKMQKKEQRATLLCTQNIPFALAVCDAVWNADIQSLQTVDQYLLSQGPEWNTFIAQMRKQLEVSCVST